MMKENGLIDGIVDGFLAVKPAGTIASFLPWPKRWISCDLIEGVVHIYNKEDDTDCLAVIHLPGSEYSVDAKEPLQFSITVKHPQTEQHQFRADTNEEYTLWIDTVRACGASSRSTRRTLSSTTSYSSRSSLISRCSSTDTDHGNGDEIEGITRRLQSLEESVYCSDEILSESSESEKTRQSLSSLQQQVETLKKSLDICVSSNNNNNSKEKEEHNGHLHQLEGENMTECSTKYKQSLELAQQMCINARQWETRYLRLSLQYLKLQTFIQHIDSGFVQQSSIQEHIESNHIEDLRTIAEFTECHEPDVNLSGKTSTFIDSLGFRTQLDNPGMILRYMCQERLKDNILTKLEPTDSIYIRWNKLLDKAGDSIRRTKETKELCRLGVPGKLRSRLWTAFINHRCSKLMKAKGPKYYQSLVQSPEISPSDKQISLDLHRSFPRNVYFNGDQGTKVPVLQRVLIAFSLHNKAIGYCQGMNMIAGMLLFHLEEETAFWGLVAILEMIMPTGYYNTDLLAARADQIIFQELVESKLPCLGAYLKHHDIDISLFSFNWFMTIFVDSLPINTVIRLWDMFLLEGHKTLLRFSLSLVKLHEFSLMQHHDSVTIFNMFRTTARTFYDADLLTKLAYNEFRPFPKRAELFKRHSEKLGELRTEHAENERQWRERQKLPDSVDRDTWDIVPAEQSLYPDTRPASCITQGAIKGATMWAVQSRGGSGFVLLKIDLTRSRVVEESEVIDNRITCCSHVSQVKPDNVSPGFLLLGTANGYVLLYHPDTLTKLDTTWVMDCVLGVLQYSAQIIVHLANGSLVKFEGLSESGLYSPSILDISTSPLKTGIVVPGVSRDQPGTDCSPVDEMWCSSLNTVYFIDLASWRVRSKLAVSPQTSTNIAGIVAFSTNIVFVTIQTTISIWDVMKKTCLSSHDCSTIFLPPPSPKSKTYQGVRMTINSLWYDEKSNTFWVGTSHGHVLIYEIGLLPFSDNDDDETSIAILSSEPLSNPLPCFLEEQDHVTHDTHDHVTPDHVTSSSPEDKSIRLLEDPLSPHVPLDTSLIMIPRDDGVGSIPCLNNMKFKGARQRNNTYSEYDVMDDITAVPAPLHHRMDDQCDIIESPSDNDLSPVHVYQAFNRYPSQENLEESDKEGEFEVIREQQQTNLLTLNTYQILSGDPISLISNIQTYPSIDNGSRVVTCGGGVEQEGVIVLWKRVHDCEKIRWQAEPVSLSEKTPELIVADNP